MFRLWFVLSSIWIVATVLLNGPTKVCLEVRRALGLGNPFDCFLEEAISGLTIETILLALGPVIAALIIGLILAWIIRASLGRRCKIRTRPRSRHDWAAFPLRAP